MRSVILCTRKNATNGLHASFTPGELRISGDPFESSPVLFLFRFDSLFLSLSPPPSLSFNFHFAHFSPHLSLTIVT